MRRKKYLNKVSIAVVLIIILFIFSSVFYNKESKLDKQEDILEMYNQYTSNYIIRNESDTQMEVSITAPDITAILIESLNDETKQEIKILDHIRHEDILMKEYIFVVNDRSEIEKAFFDLVTYDILKASLQNMTLDGD